jgi:hypothetical protein
MCRVVAVVDDAVDARCATAFDRPAQASRVRHVVVVRVGVVAFPFPRNYDIWFFLMFVRVIVLFHYVFVIFFS